MDSISRIFPNTAAELDEDLGNVRILLDSQQKSQEAELLEYFGRYEEGTSGGTTPISSAEVHTTYVEVPEQNIIDYILNPIIRESKADSKNILTSTFANITSDPKSQPKAISPIIPCKGSFQYQPDRYAKFDYVSSRSKSLVLGENSKTESGRSSSNEHKNFSTSSKHCTPGSDKWGSEKEKFLDNLIFSRNENNSVASDKDEIIKSGTVTVKESFIELPRMGRISKSFHGKSPTDRDSLSDTDVTPRRASDNMVNLTSTALNSKSMNSRISETTPSEKIKPSRPIFSTQKSHPSTSANLKEEPRKTSLSEPVKGTGTRFTTTLIDIHDSTTIKNKVASNINL